MENLEKLNYIADAIFDNSLEEALGIDCWTSHIAAKDAIVDGWAMQHPDKETVLQEPESSYLNFIMLNGDIIKLSVLDTLEVDKWYNKVLQQVEQFVSISKARTMGSTTTSQVGVNCKPFGVEIPSTWFK